MSALEGLLVLGLSAAGYGRKLPCEKNTAWGSRWAAPPPARPGQHLPPGMHTQVCPSLLNQ